MLVWVDLETTGLLASQEKILEVAAVVTDDALVEIARFHRVTSEARYHDLSKVDVFVREMHASNGLWNESILAPSDAVYDVAVEPWVLTRASARIKDVDYDLAQFIRDHCPDAGPKTGPQLAGSTVSFDREFMRVHTPFAHAQLHYRNLDVTSLNEMAKRIWPDVFAGRPRGEGSKHRAMDDILESLEVARYYAAYLGPITKENS